MEINFHSRLRGVAKRSNKAAETREILRLFLLHPERDFYVAEAAALSNLPLRDTRRTILKLEEVGILRRRCSREPIALSANTNSPLFKKLLAEIH